MECWNQEPEAFMQKSDQELEMDGWPPILIRAAYINGSYELDVGAVRLYFIRAEFVNVEWVRLIRVKGNPIEVRLKSVQAVSGPTGAA